MVKKVKALFKIVCANLKEPYFSSLLMPHFKAAHISTLLATLSPHCILRLIVAMDNSHFDHPADTTRELLI